MGMQARPCEPGIDLPLAHGSRPLHLEERPLVVRPQIPASACAPTPAPAVSSSELFILGHIVDAVAWIFDAVQATLTSSDKLYQPLKAHPEASIGNRVMLA
jgi:hypothetical protein